MKQSKRNLRNAMLRAEARSDGPPKVSKYAKKNGVQEPAPKAVNPRTGGVVGS